MRPKVSIIIPVYNAENYLEQCLDSVINQSYTNIEIICVNDGSKDNSLEIVEKFSRKDNRIIVISTDNKGTSSARNTGMSVMSGDYFTFIDSDDWYDLNLLEECVQDIEVYNSDIVMFSYISEHKSDSLKRELFDKSTIFKGEDLEILKRRVVAPEGIYLRNPASLDHLSSVCFKVYRSSIASDVKFVDLNIIGSSEDTLFNVEIFQRVNCVTYKSDIYYHYRKNTSTQFTSTYRENLWLKYLNLFKMISNINGVSPELLNTRIALSIIGLGLNELEAPVSSAVVRKRLKEIITSNIYKNAIKELSFSFFPIHWKLFFSAAKKGKVYLLFVLLKAIKKIISK